MRTEPGHMNAEPTDAELQIRARMMAGEISLQQATNEMAKAARAARPKPAPRAIPAGHVEVKCHRCGGTGHYKYNPMYGSLCFGCQGSGKRIVKAGSRAAKNTTSPIRSAPGKE